MIDNNKTEKMDILITNNTVIYPSTGESILIERLNKGLSKFYGCPVEITCENIEEFEGDIIAFCFGFTTKK